MFPQVVSEKGSDVIGGERGMVGDEGVVVIHTVNVFVSGKDDRGHELNKRSDGNKVLDHDVGPDRGERAADELVFACDGTLLDVAAGQEEYEVVNDERPRVHARSVAEHAVRDFRDSRGAAQGKGNVDDGQLVEGKVHFQVRSALGLVPDRDTFLGHELNEAVLELGVLQYGPQQTLAIAKLWWIGGVVSELEAIRAVREVVRD